LRNMPPNGGSWSAHMRSRPVEIVIIARLGQIVNNFCLLISLPPT
jgi:hypothetical protein